MYCRGPRAGKWHLHLRAVAGHDMKRAAVFAHYDKHDMVDDYVVYYLKRLHEVCSHIVFVTTSNAPKTELSRIRDICQSIIQRENVGYDFMSYKVGLQSLDIGGFDEVVICNDSVYGPLFSLDETFARMQKVECDFWGMTESHDKAYHLQSYFIVFRKKVLESRCFGLFWETISNASNKYEIIDKYEVGLSQAFIQCGLRPSVHVNFSPGILLLYGTLIGIYLRRLIFGINASPGANRRKKSFIEKVGRLFEYRQLGKKLNSTHFFWIDLITHHGMPFIKTELLRDNPANLNIRNYQSVIKRVSDYNTAYIKQHLERVTGDSSPPARI